MSEQTTLYRFFDGRGRCIYIGITDDTRKRFNQHRKSAWWREVADVDKQLFRSRAEAEKAERTAIVRHSPRYNVTHNMGRTVEVGQPARRLMSLPEAAEYLGVSDRTVRRFIADGRLTGYRAGPRLLRVDLADVENMLRVIPTAGSFAAAEAVSS